MPKLDLSKIQRIKNSTGNISAANFGGAIWKPSGIQYVGGKVDTSPSAFNTMGLTGGIGTQAEAGDFILIYRFNTAVQSAVSGFTQIDGRAQTSAIYKTYLAVGYRVAEEAGESFTSNSALITMMVFRGVSGVESYTITTAASGQIAPPPVTPVAPGAIIVAGGASNNVAIVNTPPAEALYSVFHTPSNSADIGMCVGTTAAWSTTGSQTNASSCRFSIVLAPA